MQLSTRLQNLGLAALAAVAVSLSAYAVWSVGQAPESAMTAALPGGSPLGEDRAPISGPDTDATTATDPAQDAATAGTAPDGDTPGSTAPPATSVAGWASAWSGPDADLLVIGDGFSNLRSQWIHQWATELAAERPVQIHHWAEAEDVRFNEPDVLSEGSGPGLTIWNASRGDTTIGEAAEHTQAFLGARIGLRPGMIVDQDGTELKEHDGAWNYTIGQRKGLDLRNPAADGRPRYVTDIDAATGTVTVGPRDALGVTEITADRLKVLHPVMSGSLDAIVQVRAHGGITDCRADIDGDTMTLTLSSPLQGVARGQAAVLYLPDPDGQGDVVLGSGTICGTR